MTLPKIDTACLLDFLVRLLNTPSPTGYTEQAIELVEQELAKYPALQVHRTRKGGLVAKWPVEGSLAPRALTAHVDTLGAMVKEIKPNGRLAITRIGGLQLNAVETEGCWVYTSRGGKLRGSLLIEHASVHVHGAKTGDTPRTQEHMEVRLDARTASAKETRSLDVAPGDFIAFDPRVEVTNDFVRSRFLDDKAGVATIVAAIQAMSDARQGPRQTTYFLISNYEEVGHGAASGIPDEVHELVTVDMAAVGQGQESDEFHATLCLKDSGGPYHHGLSNRLRELAERSAIPFKTDIYPDYGSDGEAFWKAGGDAAVALIGPGVDASHNYERTHLEALVGTTNWITAYLLSDS